MRVLSDGLHPRPWGGRERMATPQPLWDCAIRNVSIFVIVTHSYVYETKVGVDLAPPCFPRTLSLAFLASQIERNQGGHFHLSTENTVRN